jgi:hypothetical protein
MTTVSTCEREDDGSRRGNTVERWCFCRQCVYGFAISVEIDEEEGAYRVCGEPCVVGSPRVSADADDDEDDGDAAAIVTAGVTAMVTSPSNHHPVAPLSVLRCNICHVEVDPPPPSWSTTGPCVSDVDDTISADN